MAEKPDNVYGSYGSVPSVLPEGGGPRPMSVRADASDFGGQIGQAGEKLGGEGSDLAAHYQGIINETLATNAESQLIQKNSMLKGQLMATEGMETYHAMPAYRAAIADDNDIRSSLPLGALRMYDQLATRQKANYLGDAEGYAAGQIKKANMDSGALLVNANQFQAQDPNIASDPAKIGEAIGNVKTGIQMQMDENAPGLKKDPTTGAVSFDESTPEGRKAKTDYQTQVDHHTGIVWDNAINAVADRDPLKASQMYDQNKDLIPPVARVRIEASLAPKVINAYAQGAVGDTMMQANQAHTNILLNPPPLAGQNIKDAILSQESGNNPNSKQSVDGAIGPGQITPATFSQYAKQGEDINNPVDNRAVSARIIDDLSKRYNGDVSRIAVGYFSGPGNVAPIGSSTPWVRDTSDGNGKSTSSYVTDILNKTKNINDISVPGLSKNYAQNPNGSPLTQADFYASHKDEILSWGDQQAEKAFPGNPTYRAMVRQRLINQMDTAISAQSAQYKQDNNFIQRGINGDFTNGQAPSTYAELYQIKGMADVLNRAQVHSPDYIKGIDTQIAKMQTRDTANNSPNGYDTIQRVLEPNDDDHPNRIASQDHLDRLLGRSDGTGISMKDYTDAKQSLEASDNWKKFVSTNMKTIAQANGNQDGLGQQRAIGFYNLVTKLKDERTQTGVKETDLVNPESKEYLGALTSMFTPSRIQQIAAVAQKTRPQSVINVVPRQPNETPDQYLQRTGL